MIVRCINCNAGHSFSNRRGAKLSERRCTCGGKMEMLYNTDPIETKGLSLPEGISPVDSFGNPYIYPHRNSKNKLFLYNREKKILIPITLYPTILNNNQP